MSDVIRPGGLWVYCEQASLTPRPVAFELLGQASRLASRMNCGVTAVLVGGDGSCAASLGACGADAVLLAETPEAAVPDELQHTTILAQLIRKYEPAVLLLGATAFGRSLAPRLAARLGAGLTADCTGLEIDPETGLLQQTRPAFGGNLMATIVCPLRRPQMATVRPKVFPFPNGNPARPWTLIRENVSGGPRGFELIDQLLSGAETDIGAADLLISVGRGIGDQNNIALAEKLARRLHGTLAASRPLVDSGLLPYSRQVGQTGKTVSPKVYLALGISGAIQHMAGVAAGTLIAVNTDPEAPICAYADTVVPCDCGVFLRAMLERTAGMKTDHNQLA